jgi:hypothetical protein
MTVQLTIHNARRYDEDNLQGCQKPVLEALKNLAYIHYLPSTRKEKRTEIQIFPIGTKRAWQFRADRLN